MLSAPLIYGQQEEMAAVLQDTLIRCIAEEDDESNPAVIESQIKELKVNLTVCLFLPLMRMTSLTKAKTSQRIHPSF